MPKGPIKLKPKLIMRNRLATLDFVVTKTKQLVA